NSEVCLFLPTRRSSDLATGIEYTYTGNRLTSLGGALTGSYTYDLNGDATKDRTGMNFAYNHLNLPRTVSKAAAGTSPAVTVNYLDRKSTRLNSSHVKNS